MLLCDGAIGVVVRLGDFCRCCCCNCVSEPLNADPSDDIESSEYDDRCVLDGGVASRGDMVDCCGGRVPCGND